MSRWDLYEVLGSSSRWLLASEIIQQGIDKVIGCSDVRSARIESAR